jgi:benzoyl-CoA reductase/2-hydroxyglutaryl-CoA dehydratase subunit BcrC/BadD/HgdB
MGVRNIMYYDNFLKLCGYEPAEIEDQRPRLEKAFDKLKFTADDFKAAEEQTRKYFDTDLTSIRKMIGLWLQSLIDVTLARGEGKKLVYTMLPPLVLVQNAIAMASKDVYVTAPDILINYVYGTFFNKLPPIMEVAEADLLPIASAHCGGIKAQLGALTMGLIPMPDLFIASGFVCDQTPKVDEILNERYGIPVVYIDGTLDEEKTNWQETSDRRVEYFVQEAKDALARFEEVTGCKVTEQMVEKANLRAREMRVHCKRIADLIRDADPPPVGFNNIAALFRAANWLVNPTTYGKVEKVLDLCYMELDDRIKKGKGAVPKGAPRVAILKVCHDAAVVDRIEKAGLGIVADNTGIIAPKKEGFKSKYEDFWYQGIELHVRMGVGYANRQVELFKDLNLDGVILNYPIGCRDQCISPVKVKEVLMKELGIPVLLIEFDSIETRLFTVDAIMSRVEPFAEMLKEVKAAKLRKAAKAK